MVMLIREVYKRRNPAKLGEVKRLLEKYKATRQHEPSRPAHATESLDFGWSVCNGCRGERKRYIRVCAKSMAKSRGHPDGFLQIISCTHAGGFLCSIAVSGSLNRW